MTPANKAGEKKKVEAETKPSGSDDDAGGRSRSTAAGTSQADGRRTRLTFAPGTNAPPLRRVPLRPRTASMYRADEGGDRHKGSESDEEGSCSSTSGTGRENERPTRTDSAWPSLLLPPSRPVSPKLSMVFAGQVGDEAKASRAGEEEVAGSPISTRDRMYRDLRPPSTPRLGRAVLINERGSSDRNRTPSPAKRKHMRREKTLDSEYRRDLLAFEGIDVRDFQEEADAEGEAEDEESPKKKGKRVTSYESPDRRLILKDAGSPIKDSNSVRNFRARVVAQTGFATHFARAVSDNLEEEVLFVPEVGWDDKDQEDGVSLIADR